MIGIKIKLIRAHHVDEDVSDFKNNTTSDGNGLLVDVKKLACKCNVLDKYVYILIHKEFRDGFTPYTSLTTNDGLLLHTFTLQYVDSTNDDSIHECPITLGHKIDKTY